jgi:hypothetical protein
MLTGAAISHLRAARFHAWDRSAVEARAQTGQASRMLLLRLSLAAALGACAIGCSVPAIVDVNVGPFDYTITASRVMIPDALRDPGTMSIRRIACMNDMGCPQPSGGQPAVRCVDGACDPEPFEFMLASDVIDLNENASVQRYGDRVTRIEVRGGVWEATTQGLRNPVGPTQVYWGPESASAIDSPGVQLLGTLPVIDLSTQDTATGMVEMDPAGSAALSDHLVRISRRLRLFARPRIDVAPGGPLPTGGIALRLQLAVHVEGQLVR